MKRADSRYSCAFVLFASVSLYSASASATWMVAPRANTAQGESLVSMQSTFTVPAAPADGASTFYLFPAMTPQDNTAIMQPILVWSGAWYVFAEWEAAAGGADALYPTTASGCPAGSLCGFGSDGGAYDVVTAFLPVQTGDLLTFEANMVAPESTAGMGKWSIQACDGTECAATEVEPPEPNTVMYPAVLEYSGNPPAFCSELPGGTPNFPAGSGNVGPGVTFATTFSVTTTSSTTTDATGLPLWYTTAANYTGPYDAFILVNNFNQGTGNNCTLTWASTSGGNTDLWWVNSPSGSSGDILGVDGSASNQGLVNTGTAAFSVSAQPEQSFGSANGATQLVMDNTSGVLETEQNGMVTWPSCQAAPANVAVMQANGDFAVYDTLDNLIWDSATAGNPGAYLEITNSGSLEIWDQSDLIWTNRRSSFRHSFRRASCQ